MFLCQINKSYPFITKFSLLSRALNVTLFQLFLLVTSIANILNMVVCGGTIKKRASIWTGVFCHISRTLQISVLQVIKVNGMPLCHIKGRFLS